MAGKEDYLPKSSADSTAHPPSRGSEMPLPSGIGGRELYLLFEAYSDDVAKSESIAAMGTIEEIVDHVMTGHRTVVEGHHLTARNVEERLRSRRLFEKDDLMIAIVKWHPVLLETETDTCVPTGCVELSEVLEKDKSLSGFFLAVVHSEVGTYIRQYNTCAEAKTASFRIEEITVKPFTVTYSDYIKGETDYPMELGFVIYELFPEEEYMFDRVRTLE